MEDILIEESVPEDMFGIREVQKITWIQTYANEKLGITKEDVALRFADDNSEEAKAKLEDRKVKYYGNPNLKNWVAKIGDKIVAFCTAARYEDHNRIHAIYVLPDFQKQSIGFTLMSKALDWLGAEKDIFIDVVSYNQKAIDFYRKFGFIETGRVLENKITFGANKVATEIDVVRRAKK